MHLVSALGTWLSRWLDEAAFAAVSMGAALRPAKKFQINEQADDTFVVRDRRSGSAVIDSGEPLRFVDGQFVGAGGARIRSRFAKAEVEIVLASRRFMFRSLDLPTQAAGFLDAVVRSQIDKLTPWNPAEAAFGCSAPAQTSAGRVSVTVAATARSSILPLMIALEKLAPESILVSAAIDAESDSSQSPIRVLAQQTNRQRRTRRMRQFLVAAPALAGFIAVVALSAWIYVGAVLEASQLRVSQQLAERRAALSGGRGDAAKQAAVALVNRKRTTAAGVLILESLSRALPDDTYLTELQIEGEKLQISGITREAASLIKIIEQTEHFEHATFFAPTTQTRNESGEHFQLEAKIVTPFPAVR